MLFPSNPKRDDHQYIWYKSGTKYEEPVDVILRRTQALLDQIRLLNGPNLDAEQAELNTFKGQAANNGNNQDLFK